MRHTTVTACSAAFFYSYSCSKEAVKQKPSERQASNLTDCAAVLHVVLCCTLQVVLTSAKETTSRVEGKAVALVR
jgi:iron only hydrogenase large subunit-like protein